MNKKSLITMLLSLCLVAVIGVGSTFAYLSSTTSTLTNTFTVGKVDGSLSEFTSKVGDTFGGVKVAGNDTGMDYKNLVPGQTVTKAPFVTVKANSVNAWAYIKVTGLDALLLVTDSNNHQFFDVDVINNAKWEKISSGSGRDGIYRYKTPFSPSTADQNTDSLFSTITVKSDAEGAPTAISPIILKACIVQADSLVDSDDADDLAATKLN